MAQSPVDHAWCQDEGDKAQYRGRLKESEGSLNSGSGVIDVLGLDALIPGLHRLVNGHDDGRYVGNLENAALVTFPCVVST